MGKESKTDLGHDTLDSMSVLSMPSMPPPPYFQTHFVNPSSLKTAINAKLDKPALWLFRLSVRFLQFAFTLASGISYAIELQHRYSASTTNLIFAEVVFGLTIIALIVDSITIQYYRLVWMVEFTLAILWIVCFAIFYRIYLVGEVDPDYAVVDLGRMEGAIWSNLINALLWFGSALFSSIMCCSGVKAVVKGESGKRRQRKNRNKNMQKMDTGAVGAEKL